MKTKSKIKTKKYAREVVKFKGREVEVIKRGETYILIPKDSQTARRVNIDLPIEQYKILSIHCAVSDLKIRNVVTEAVTDYLQKIKVKGE